ncbi:DUF859 family phage minor structural protein [Streptococcus anginosus]|uniref:DUF859 domain-containing protein n=1 Tax=Streptococcus anginosus TaxID=1328 RepID=UPI00124760E2|nr:DUF859 domain-containing protein [Streptococcus anginosus]KAA9259777.1 hypothetical protein F6I23_07650 [Streptococcus anginosus]
MAEFWSNNDRGYRIRLWIDQTSQNISDNSSQVRVRLALLNTTTAFAQYSCSAWVDLNGQRLNWSGSPNMTSYNSTIMLIDKTITVGHNADGTKSFGLSAHFNGSGGWSPGTLSIGGNSFTLTTIPRSSSVSVGAGTIGSSVTINISRQSSSFKHTVRYAWGNKSGTIASNVDTSTTWTIPLDFANDIPNSATGTGTIYVDTYSGGTRTGTQSATLTASVPASMKPTFTGVSLSDSNTAAQNVVPNANTFIQIISNIKVAFNGASGSYGSNITGYRAEIVGKNQTTNVNGGTLGIMNYSGAITVRASVSDSRGRWSETRDVSVTVLEYFAPALSFSIARTGATSSTLTVTRNAKVAPLTVSGSQKNQMKLTFKVAKFGSNDYKVDTGSASGIWTTVSSLTNSSANLQGEYAANSSWTVLGILEDKFTRTEFAVNVATEQVVLSYDRYGVGVNKTRERGALDVKGNTYIEGFLRHCVEWAGNTSVNNLLEGGSAWTNKDTPNGGWGILETFRIGNLSGKEATQRFTQMNGNKVWYRYRHYQTGNWTPWVVEGIDNFYPIGSIYQSTAPTNPTTFMGGVWERFGNGKVLVGVDETDSDFNTANKSGGYKEHRHAAGNLEAAIGSANSNIGSLGFKASNINNTINDWTYAIGGTVIRDGNKIMNHNTKVIGHTDFNTSLQPYVTTYMWRRIG